MKTKSLTDLPVLAVVLTTDIAATGPIIPAIERLRFMISSGWEDFILEWAHSLKSKYVEVEKCGGAGDMGRDVVAYVSSVGNDPWDNYQCKHYDHPLLPSDVWCELGKLCYFTYIHEYTFSRAYYFVSPQGAGNKLSKLLRSPDKLKQGLFDAWDDKCKSGITSTKDILLDVGLKAHIDALDFSQIRQVSPLTIIEEHKKSPWHTARFGGGLPPRSTNPVSPDEMSKYEENYIRALLDAYEDRLHSQVASMEHLTNSKLKDHLNRSRQDFYCAEALREFSKDNVPPGTFDGLLDEIHSGIIDEVEAAHTDAFERVLAAVKQAKVLSLTSNALVTRVTTNDKGGMCHQLANIKKVKWRP